MSFVHLRVASGYSFKYGTSHISDLVKRAAEFGAKSLALTDRDSLAGVIRFAKECEAHGINPIIGVNLSLEQKKYRVTLLAEPGGLASLYRLFTALNFQAADGVITSKFLGDNSKYLDKLLLMHGPESQLVAALKAKIGRAHV